MLRLSYEERVRSLEEALTARDRINVQLTESLSRAEAEYHRVSDV